MKKHGGHYGSVVKLTGFLMLAGLAWCNSSPAANPSWSGGTGGAGTSWNSGLNWNGGTVPVPGDSVLFTNTGLTAGKVISLDASQIVASVTIATCTNFTIGSANDGQATNALTVTNVTRVDVAGTENNQSIYAPIVLGGASVWDIAGSGALIVTSKTVNAKSYTLEKRGGGTLQIGDGANAVTLSNLGKTTVSAGTLQLIDANNSMGNVDIGGGGANATLTIGTGSSGSGLHENIADGATITVMTQGTFNITADKANETLGTIAVQAGGKVAAIGWVYPDVRGALNMSGGNVNLGANAFFSLYSGSAMHTGDVESVIEGSTLAMGIGAYMTFTVYHGASPVDMVIRCGMSDRYVPFFLGGINKQGSGVLELQGASTFTHASGVAVNAGTLLVNNPTGSGTGTQKVQVNGGGTLGGTGLVGGVSAYSNANVTVTGSASNNLALLAPGAIDTNTGAHVIGTLTVGGAAQTNNVTLAKFSRLPINFATDGRHDQLVVHGRFTVAPGNTNSLSLTVPSGFKKSGIYTLVSADNGVSGQFVASVGGLPSGASVLYNATTIQVSVPSGATAILFR